LEPLDRFSFDRLIGTSKIFFVSVSTVLKMVKSKIE